MINKDFFQALNDLQAKGVDKEFFISSLEAALTSAYKKNFGEAKNAEVKLNEEKNTIKVYSYKTVVEEVTDPDKEMSLVEAKTIKKSYKIGDMVAREETPKTFGRIAAQTAKQVIMQRLREAERNRILTDVSTKQDALITVIVRRIENGNVYCDMGLGQVEGVLSIRDQIPGESYVTNSRIKAYVKTVKEGYDMPYVQLSRANAGFVKKLIEMEVPEIANGEIEIKNIVREAGYRTKIAVYCKDHNIDAVGACIGNKGSRINEVINELNGEKIDIIEWSDSPAEYIARALSPATVLHVQVNPIEKTSVVVVPDDKLSLAIGKGGHNVRLAVKLTNWKIDVKSESQMPKYDEPKETNNTDLESLFAIDNAFDDLDN